MTASFVFPPPSLLATAPVNALDINGLTADVPNNCPKPAPTAGPATALRAIGAICFNNLPILILTHYLILNIYSILYLC